MVNYTAGNLPRAMAIYLATGLTSIKFRLIAGFRLANFLKINLINSNKVSALEFSYILNPQNTGTNLVTPCISGINLNTEFKIHY